MKNKQLKSYQDFKKFTNLTLPNFKLFATILLVMIYFASCNDRSDSDAKISTDTATIAKGEMIFNQHCGGCHNFRQDGIGPNLSGITMQASSNWIRQFIKNPKKVIEANDQRATELSKKYKGIMPPFSHLNEDQINSVIAFLHTHKKEVSYISKSDAGEITNPITEQIQVSDLHVNLALVTQIPASIDSGRLPLTRINKLDFEPYSGNLFLVDLRGKLYKLQKNAATVYMDMSKLRPKFVAEPRLSTGFGSFSFHPDFVKNGLLYTVHTESSGSGKADFYYPDSIKVALQCVVTEWKTRNPGSTTFSGTSRELFRVNMVTGMHGIQDIAFNPLAKPGDPDFGLLYICIGDGASVEEGYPSLVHSKEKVWGTILRIDPNGKNSSNGQYGIPDANPFAKNRDKNILGEIYAYGFRNPHRITWTKSGDILVCNIGQAHIESVNLIMPGHDYGWPLREGAFSLHPAGDLTKLYTLPSNDSIYNITYPIAAYDHDEGIACKFRLN